MKERNISFGKREALLLIGILIIAAVLALAGYIRNTSSASYVEISVVNQDSQRTVLNTFPLNENREHRILTNAFFTNEPDGMNHLIIRDGSVWISEANCPNHDCVRKGKIHESGEMIVCIPHRLTVTIVGQ